jgi:ATP-binding cassette ChvD family protein
MAQEYIYQMEGLEKRTPQDDVIFSDIWLSFFPDAKIGVVGPNGSGKSTLLRIMAGIDNDYRGETWVDPDATVGYLAQEPELDEDATVRENVEQGVAEIKELIDEYNAVSAKFGEASPDEMNELIERQAELQDQIEAADGWEIDSKVDRAMEALRLPPEDAPVEQLSGGERRRVALCRLLLKQPDLMLLDEPTNHLDAETVDWLEDTLREWDGCVVIVTHDRYFLDNVTGWVLELEGTKGIPFEGNYSSWLEQKLEQFAEEGNEDSPRAAALSRELEWAKATEKARTSSDRLAELEARREADDKKLGRKQRNITIPEGPRLGQNVIKAENLRKGYDDRLLVDNLSFDIPPGAIVGVIGPNGAGKSTLFRMITGEETPDEGSVEVGDTVEIASVDQMRSELDANKDEAVWEFISDGQETLQLGDRKIQARAYVGAFGLTGQVQQRSVGTLSGGERSRVQLAKTLLEGGNMLLLDEPENDLDMTTLQALEMALEEFTGSSMVISHDRWFLDRIATHIIAFEGNSQVVWFEGNYEAYEKDRRRRLGEAADRPSRIQYQSIG